MVDNPYAAPKAHVEDIAERWPDGDFVPEGRGLPAGNGWRWIADAWAFTSEQRWTFVGVFLLLFLLQLAVNFVPIIGPIAMGFVFPVLLGGILLGCDAVRRGERLEVGHLFAGFQRHAGKLMTVGAISLAFGILMALVMLMIVGTSFAPFLLGGEQPNPEQAMGLLLPMLLAMCVVVALSLPLTMAMLFTPALIVLNESEVVPALKTSFFACLKNILPFLVWSIAIFGLSILAAIPFFLGWLLLGPVLMVSLYLAYRDVFYEV
jgi:uncharacterized membrane protein